MSPTPPSSPAPRIKRRRVRLRGESRAMRDRRRGRIIAAAMAALALIYGAAVAWQWHRIMQNQGDIAMGASAQDVRYRLGTPTSQTGPTWVYARAGHVLALSFDATGHLDHARCTSRRDADQPCPTVASIGIGTSEGDMVSRFGAPDRETLAGGDKIAAYDGIGFQFRLAQGAIVQIDHHRAAPSPQFWRHLAWELLP